MENLSGSASSKSPETQATDMPIDSGTSEAVGFRAIPIPTSLIRTTFEHFGSGKLVELTQNGDGVVLKLDKYS